MLGELIDSIPDPVIGCDAAGHVVYWSPAAEALYGYPAAEASGRPVIQLLRTRFPAPLMEIMEEVTDTGHWQGTLVHVGRDGNEHTVESRWTARYDDGGRLVGGFGIERELGGLDERSAPRDEELLPVRELERAERLDGLGQMIGGMAHGFNNELGIIINYAAFIAAELSEQRAVPRDLAAVGSDLAEIQAAAERAARAVRQVLAFARQEESEPGPVDLSRSVAEIEEMLRGAAGSRVRMVTRLTEGLPPVELDPSQLHQLLVHLVGNASDAMPEGGTITIDTSSIQLDEESAAWGDGTGAGLYVRLRVSDTGSGMLPSVLERAFDPFFTTKPVGHGTGLGLSGVYGIVSRAGGRVRLHSEPGVGTTVVVLLPAMRTEAPPPAEPQVDGPAEEATVLVVDDEPAMRELAARILRRGGYRVIDGNSGPEALAAAEAEPGAVDLLLTDVVMPGMTGPEVAAALRERRPGVPVLYMSGFAAGLVADATGGEQLLDKPFTAPDLLRAVSAALGAAPPSGEG